MPLAEASELYQVKVFSGGSLVRDVTTETPNLSLEGLPQGAATVQVMQLSQAYGPGLPSEIVVSI